MHRLALAVGCFLTCVVFPSAAQSGASPKQEVSDSADVLVLDHDFTGPGEFVRVFLQTRQVYRAELSTPDVTIAIQSAFQRTKAPRVYPLLDSSAPSGGSAVEIYPDVDGEYELRAIDFRGGVATRLRLYRDVRESRRRMALLDQPGWEAGVEVAVGWHSGFDQVVGGFPSTIQERPAGRDFEACFTARSAPSWPALSMCALGVGWDSQHGAPSTLWIFTEPRLRVLGKFRRGRSNWEMGGLFRVAIGSVSRRSDTPLMLAPGIYLARHIRTDQDGSGWSLHASYSFASLQNTSNAPGGGAPTSRRLLLGVGRYR